MPPLVTEGLPGSPVTKSLNPLSPPAACHWRSARAPDWQLPHAEEAAGRSGGPGNWGREAVLTSQRGASRRDSCVRCGTRNAGRAAKGAGAGQKKTDVRGVECAGAASPLPLVPARAQPRPAGHAHQAPPLPGGGVRPLARCPQAERRSRSRGLGPGRLRPRESRAVPTRELRNRN